MSMRPESLLLFFALLVGTTASATHNRAGEITYQHLEGTTYEVTITTCLLYTSPSPRDRQKSRMPSSA